MGKLLPTPYPGQSMEEYREQLINFKNNYWSFIKPSKGGSKFIPLPPLKLNNKKMARKLSEHVEEELFNKEKRVIPNVPPEKRVKLSEGVEPKKVIKTTPKIVKESILGSVEDKPVKKKRPYYKKKYNKPKVEVVIPEPVKTKNYFIHGLLVGIVLTAIICHIIYSV